jgi:uncharacterized protein (TIGR02996 family)
VPALAPADHDLVAKLRARLRDHHANERAATQDADALLAEIRTNPADDRTRLVYADVLQQRGDPRGELIALQLAGDSSAASTQ